MNLKSKLLSLFITSLFSLSIGAQEAKKVQLDSVETRQDICYDPGILLDPEIPLADKQNDLGNSELSAKSGDENALYLLGSLYRLGEKHPAKIFIQDTEKAKKYLSNAAILGNYAAMAAMAEIELKNESYRDAMLWAQVFAHYSELESKQINDVINHAYQAYLLQRIMHFTNKDKKLYNDQIFIDDLSAFHNNYNEKITNSRSKERMAAKDVKYQICRGKKGYDQSVVTSMISGASIDADSQTMRKMSSPGYAYYFLIIDPKGRVTRALTVDSMPDATYAKALASVTKKLKFNEIKGTEIRTVYIPLSFDDFSVAIKKPAAKK